MSELHPPIVHARLRTAALAVALVSSVAVLTLGAGQMPAHASTASDEASLLLALSPGADAVITLTSDVALSLPLTIPRTVTLDLDGFDLTGYNTTVAPGVTFTIDDLDGDADPATVGRFTSSAAGNNAGIMTGGATLVVDGGEVVASGANYAAGIGGQYGTGSGALIVNGGTISATGGWLGAGIGGGYFSGADVTVHGGTTYATGGEVGAGIGGGGGNAPGGTFTMDGGTVYANGGHWAAGIGGGGGGNGGSITIDGGIVDAQGGDQGGPGLGGGGASGTGGSVVIGAGAVVTARGPGGYTGDGSAVGPGAGNGVDTFGTLDIAGELVLPGGSYLRIPVAGTATVSAGGSITGGGEIQGLGTVVNHGAIRLPPANVTVALVTDHDYSVTFSPAAPSVRVLAATFAAAGQTLPTLTRPGWSFAGWNTSATGAGTTFTSTSILPGAATSASVPVALYARWTPPTLVVSPATYAVAAGDSLSFTVEAFASGGASVGDVTGQVTFSTDNGAQDPVTGADIEFHAAGSTVVTATLTADPSVTDTAVITVAATNAVQMTIVLSDASVDQGDTVHATVAGLDAYGNTVPDMATKVVISSDHPTDVISGMDIRFPGASTHVITATLISDPGVVASASVVVRPALGAIAMTGQDPLPAFALAGSLLVLGLVAAVASRLRRRFAG